MITEKIEHITHNHPKKELTIKYKNGDVKIINMSYEEFLNMLKSGNFNSLDNV